ncbi:DUF4231 domain-containing protein [Sinomonas sp. ASV322]|uniref:DUF4231 domain-containing protein n=1 Tax=Sinomonas sp. ASV322 TaxID=3041920 RepID=UPI0027DE7723|nr:DUF4231 domain-containing protein [Sinomonas sp. ASV322]MDQ4502299.1 DUF4231 domain-containing protein [Sinomonas sp. ASV322]
MDTGLELPGFFKDADAASLAAQRTYLALNRTRLWSAVAGALGGAITWSAADLDAGALVALAGFLVALVAELVLAYLQPERDWYSGRALAESMKTMAWCYAVGGDPFASGIDDAEARRILRQRAELLLQKGGDKISMSTESPLVTAWMTELRHSDFETRRAAYLEHRTRDQRNWYARKARQDKRKADAWRTALVAAEIIAVTASTLRVTKALEVDLAGILGAAIGAGAAWLALKQYAQLSAAYSLASRELSLQEDLLSQVNESEWAHAVSDAEEAISREHTMWLASRNE